MKFLFCVRNCSLLIPVALSYVGGIFLSLLITVPESFSFITIFVPAAVCLVFRTYHKKLLSILFLGLTFFLFGAVHADRAYLPVPGPHHIVHWIDLPHQAVIVGTLSAKVTKLTDKSRAQIDVSFIRTETNGELEMAEGRVLLTVKGIWPDRIKPGDSLIARATLQPPPMNNTPGTFNYREYLARKGILLTGFVNHPSLIKSIDRIDAPFQKKYGYLVQLLRTHIGFLIDANLPERIAALYKALLIGDRSEVASQDLETFKRAGIMHMLAISGLHMGLLATILFSVIFWIFRRSEYVLLRINAKKTSLLLSLPVLLFYALLTGANPPVVRSLIMIVVFIFAFAINRLHSPLTTLSGAAFLILLVDPMAVFAPSFQLSFAAVASILLLAPKIFSLLGISVFAKNDHTYINRCVFLFLGIGIVTISATIGTLPLMLFHFNRISLVTLPANLIIQPIICFLSLPLGIMSIVLSSLSTDASAFLLKTGGYGIYASLEIGDFLSRHESTQLWLPDPSIALCALYYTGIASLGIDLSRRLVTLISVPMLCASLLYIFIPLTDYHILKRSNGVVTVLDIGHGSANVIEMKNGHTVLIDGGAKSAPGYDCGERIIAPFLWHRRIGRVDDIVITHDDADHYNGILTIIERFRPKRLIIPFAESPKKGLQEIIACAHDHDVEIFIPDSTTIIEKGDEQLLVIPADLFSTKEQMLHSSSLSEDDRGFVLKFISGDSSMLFPGDITNVKEQELIDGFAELESTLLLSPHHGSSSSNTYPFLKAVNPDYLIFSANDHGSGLFPSTIAVHNAALLDISTLTTSIDGSVTITFTHTSAYQIDTYNRSDQRFYRKG